MSTQTYTLRAKMIGAMLREARLSAGISLKDGAAGIGVTSSTLSSYEYGRKPVSLPELELLAFRYDFSLRNFWHPDQFIKHQDENLNPTLLLSLRQRQIAGWLQKQREEGRADTERACQGRRNQPGENARLRKRRSADPVAGTRGHRQPPGADH